MTDYSVVIGQSLLIGCLSLAMPRCLIMALPIEIAQTPKLFLMDLCFELVSLLLRLVIIDISSGHIYINITSWFGQGAIYCTHLINQ